MTFERLNAICNEFARPMMGDEMILDDIESHASDLGASFLMCHSDWMGWARDLGLSPRAMKEYVAEEIAEALRAG